MSNNRRPIAFRPWSQRITTSLWGILVIVVGGAGLANYYGHTIDMELVGIYALAAIGTWLLASALVSMVRRSDR